MPKRAKRDVADAGGRCPKRQKGASGAKGRATNVREEAVEITRLDYLELEIGQFDPAIAAVNPEEAGLSVPLVEREELALLKPGDNKTLRRLYESGVPEGMAGMAPFMFPATHAGPLAGAGGHYYAAARLRYRRRKRMEKARRVIQKLDDFDLTTDVKISKPGYQGVKFCAAAEQPPTKLKYWRPRRDKVSILEDKLGRRAVIVVPHDESRSTQLEGFLAASNRLRTKMPTSKPGTTRGNFPSIYLQLHRDQGLAGAPMYSSSYRENEAPAREFLEDKDVAYYAGWISGVVQTYATQVHMRQAVANRRIKEKHGLDPLFGIYPSIALNYDTAATERHRDNTNLAGAYCPLLVVKNTDPGGGGQLVLEEAGLIVELHEGDLILFPSALLTHSNLALAPGQERTTVAIWSGANLHSWADEGCEAHAGHRPSRPVEEALFDLA